MNLKVTARNRSILEKLAHGMTLMQVSATLGVNYSQVCTARSIFRHQGFDLTSEMGRAACLEWLAKNPLSTGQDGPFPQTHLEIVKRYAHREPFHKIAPAMGLKISTVEVYYNKVMGSFTIAPGKDRLLFLRRWLIEQGYYPADHNFDAVPKPIENTMADPAFL